MPAGSNGIFKYEIDQILINLWANKAMSFYTLPSVVGQSEIVPLNQLHIASVDPKYKNTLITRT